MTFDTTSTSAADFKTVIAECGNDVTANAVVVAVDKIEVQEGGSWVDRTGQTIYVDVGTTVSFRAQPAPTGATWPSDCPVWSGDASGKTGSQVAIGFTTASEKHVTAGPGEKTVTVEVIEVRIEKCSASFLPKGGSEDNTTTLRAYVQPSNVKGKFKFTLCAVSDEKGYCLNAPIFPPTSGEDSDSWKDFQFPSQSGFSISGSNNDTAETSSDNISEATVTIKSFDYGSYGRIKAQLVPQNTTLTFIAKEDGGTSDSTPIPADTNCNHIADSWSGNTGPGASCCMGDDRDTTPPGSTVGDGLTRFEEYRGFMIKGVHTRTNPATKDLFVYLENPIGTGYYASGSGATIHDIYIYEWTGIGKRADGKRIINPNRDSATSGTQYGLHIYDGGTPGGSEGGHCYGDPDDSAPMGSPNTCWKIKVNTGNITNWFPASAQALIDRSLAHEMGHGTAVPHHSPDITGGVLCIMREYCTDTNIGTTFCSTSDNCISKIDIKDQ